MTTETKVKTASKLLKRDCIAELEARGYFLQQGRHSRDGRQWWNTFRVVPLHLWDRYTDGEPVEAEIEGCPQIAYRKCDAPDWSAVLALAGQMAGAEG